MNTLDLIFGQLMVAMFLIVISVGIAEGINFNGDFLKFKNKRIQRICRWSLTVVCPVLYVLCSALILTTYDTTQKIIVETIIALAEMLIFVGGVAFLLSRFISYLIRNPLNNIKKWLCE